MDHEVDAAERLATAGRDGGQLLVAGDIEREDQRVVQLAGQLAHVFLEPLALKCEREACASFGDSFGNGPGDRALVGDADDEPVKSGEVVHE